MPTEVDLELLKKNLNCEFEELVGKSSSGTLYRVQHKVYGSCALKYLEGAAMANPQFLQNLSSEVEKSRKILYPKFARIYEFAFHPYPYILREWIPGENLQAHLEKGALTPLEATNLIIEIAWGIQAAYNFGLRHKNLKPANILIREDRCGVVLDALLPLTIPSYISPEQCSGKKSDIRSDIYSLGIIYYQTLTGCPPFSGSVNKIMRQHMETPPPAIQSLPQRISEIIAKALAKNPEARYQNPLEFIYMLKEASQSLRGVEPVSKKTGEIPEDKEERPSTLRLARDKTMEVCVEEGEDDSQPTEGSGEIAMEEEIKELDEKTMPLTDILDELSREAGEFSGEDKEKEDKEHQEKVTLKTETELSQLEIIEIEDLITIEPDYENLPKELPEYLQKALLLATDVKILRQDGETLTSFTIVCLQKWQDQAMEYLQTVLRRECWVVREAEGAEEVEIIVDLELAKTLRYFNFFDDCIQKALSELPQATTIHKSIITRMESLEEENITLDPEKTSFNASFSKLSSIFSLFDKIPEIGEEEPKGSGLPGLDEIPNLKPGTIPDAEEVPIELPEDEIANLKPGTIPDAEEVSIELLEEGEGEGEKTLDLVVNFNNPYQTRAWFKLVKEYNWETGKHFEPKKQGKEARLKNMCFTINLLELKDYNKKQMGMSSIKEFFQGDYEMARLDQGGMAAVLKLTTKNESNVILLRAENYWAREKFAPYLCVRRGAGGKEFVYAEVPKGTEFVVKIAFEGREEELIYEARLLFNLAQEAAIARHIIGIVQQGSFLASEASEAQKEQVGYYLLLEYASLGNLEQFSRRFPENRLPAATAFLIMYSMVKTLRVLKQKGIIHRDIKPHNILLDANGVAKLSDFGLAITVSEAGSQLNEERRRLLRLVDKEFLQITTEKEQAEVRLKKLRDRLERQGLDISQEEFEQISRDIGELLQQIENLIQEERARAEGLKTRYRPMSVEEIAIKGEFAGSMYYAAPEQFSPSKLLTCACDVYQIGAVAYRMLTGKPPVKGRNISQVMGQIVLGQKPKVSDVLKASPLISALSDLIYQMMENDPEQRISIEQVEEKMEEILLEYGPQIEAEPEYEPNSQELTAWRQKEKYAKKFHLQILPELQRVMKEVEKKCMAWEMRSKKILKSVYISLPEQPGKSIRFRCPNCSRKLQLPPGIVGKKIRCPNCQQKLIAKSVEG